MPKEDSLHSPFDLSPETSVQLPLPTWVVEDFAFGVSEKKEAKSPKLKLTAKVYQKREESIVKPIKLQPLP